MKANLTCINSTHKSLYIGNCLVTFNVLSGSVLSEIRTVQSFIEFEPFPNLEQMKLGYWMIFCKSLNSRSVTCYTD